MFGKVSNVSFGELKVCYNSKTPWSNTSADKVAEVLKEKGIKVEKNSLKSSSDGCDYEYKFTLPKVSEGDSFVCMKEKARIEREKQIANTFDGFNKEWSPHNGGQPVFHVQQYQNPDEMVAHRQTTMLSALDELKKCILI